MAQDEVRRLRHSYIGTEHLVLGLIADGGGMAGRLLARHGAHLESARRQLDRLLSDEVLAGPRPDDAELLKTVGIDLEEVRRLTEESFGREAVDAAT